VKDPKKGQKDSSANTPQKKECKFWATETGCKYGDKCNKKASHTPERAYNVAKKESKPTTVMSSVLKGKGNKKSKKARKEETESVASSTDSSDDTEQQLNSVVIITNIKKEDESDKSMVHLGWDSGASITCTSDLSFIENPIQQKIVMIASGLGGKRTITHVGKSKTFNDLKMHYIKDGQTPNLLSVAESLEKDAGSKKRKYALFSANGAVRFEANKKVAGLLENLYEAVEDENAILGTAKVVNKVYYQSFKDLRGCDNGKQ
jgi:hypothetical protein